VSVSSKHSCHRGSATAFDHASFGRLRRVFSFSRINWLRCDTHTGNHSHSFCKLLVLTYAYVCHVIKSLTRPESWQHYLSLLPLYGHFKFYDSFSLLFRWPKWMMWRPGDIWFRFVSFPLLSLSPLPFIAIRFPFRTFCAFTGKAFGTLTT